MNRRDAVLALAAMAVAGRPALAQKPARVPRVGMLILASLPSVASAIDGFRASLRELGHVDGRTIRIEILSAEGNAERLPELVLLRAERVID